MKLWVSNPLWALHWFGSPSNWLRSTPQSLPEASITHCHAADCTQGFPSTVCKCAARISGEISLHEELGNVFEFLHEFKDACVCSVVLLLPSARIDCVSARSDSAVVSAACIKLLDHELRVETSGTN